MFGCIGKKNKDKPVPSTMTPTANKRPDLTPEKRPLAVGPKVCFGQSRTFVYQPEKNEPELTVKKVGLLKRSFGLKQEMSANEEIIETRKNPPPNEVWASRMFVLRDDALYCYEETAPHKLDENVIGQTVIPL